MIDWGPQTRAVKGGRSGELGVFGELKGLDSRAAAKQNPVSDKQLSGLVATPPSPADPSHPASLLGSPTETFRKATRFSC